jgi:hypothetical protein
LVPARTCAPPVTWSAPLPLMAPKYWFPLDALVMVSVLLPSVTMPLLSPARPTIDAPDVVPEMSNVAAAPAPTVTRTDCAIEPVPVSASAPPLTVVAPV